VVLLLTYLNVRSIPMIFFVPLDGSKFLIFVCNFVIMLFQLLNSSSQPQVSDRYRLVASLSKLRSLDGKDVCVMREAIGRLDAMIAGKLREVLYSCELKKIYASVDTSDEKNTEKTEQKVLAVMKKKVTCGPEVLKGYREYKLGVLLKSELIDAVLNVQDSPYGNKENGRQRKRTREGQNNEENFKDKIRKSEGCQVNKVQDEESGHVLTYLLQTHSLNNDPKDWDTKVWMCEFEPDVNNPGHTTNLCATCGGDSVCFINCDTGVVMKKYKQPQEVFYCLAWTVIERYDSIKGESKKCSMLAIAGRHGDIKLIDPEQLICYQEVSHHKKAIDALVFHPLHPTWLFSGSEDKTIILWDIDLPNSTEARKLVTLKASNIVRQIVVVPHGKVLVGSCDDGCYVWNIDNIDDHQTRSAVFKFIFPGERRLPVDSVSCISNCIVATKRIEEGQCQLWYSTSEFMQNDVVISHILPWRVTDTPFLKFNFISDGSVLLAGDDEGFVWAYDLSKVHGQLPNPDERDRKGPLELRHAWCLRCSNPLAKLFNHVSAGHQMKFIVAVSDTNVVAIWRKSKPKNET